MMKNKFGVDSYIWSENFCKYDIGIIEKAKKMGFECIDFAIGDPEEFPVKEVKDTIEKTGLEPICTIALSEEANPVSDDPDIRANAVKVMKRCIDICNEIGAKILGGVNYTCWGYLTRKPRTEKEWNYAVNNMKMVTDYAQKTGDVVICVECVNRFETHILNIASDAVQFCKDVGAPNIKVHLDCFHMIREEKSFRKAVLDCGKEYLGYVHVNENDRGIPGTGMVPFEEFFRALVEIGYEGPLVIESFDPSFEKTAGNCAIWRKFAETGEDLAREGLVNLKKIASAI